MKKDYPEGTAAVCIVNILMMFTVAMAVYGQAQDRPPLQPAVGPVSLEAGTQIAVRLNEAIDGNAVWIGRHYPVTISQPVIAEERLILLPVGRTCTIEATGTTAAGRFRGRNAVDFKLINCMFDGATYPVESLPLTQGAAPATKNTSHGVVIGGIAGALIGEVAGGGIGAAVGAGAGAASGAVIGGLVHKQQLHLPVESQLVFILDKSVTLGGEK